MAFSAITQIREGVVVGSTPQYDVTSYVKDKGDLPDVGVFLMEIIELDDPKRDELARVVSIADFDAYLTNRLDAIRLKKGFYRTGSLSLHFTGVVNANNAALQIIDELNAMVGEYQVFTGSFNTGPGGIDILLPQPNVGLLTPLVAEYNEVVTQRTAQQAVVTAQTEECAAASAAVTTAQASVTSLQASVSAVSLTQASLTTASGALTASQTSNATLSPQVQGTLDAWAANRVGVGAGPEQTAMDAYLLNPSGTLYSEYVTNWVGAQTALAQAISNVTAALGALSVSLAQLNGDLAVASAAVTTAQTTSDACQVELAQATAVLGELVTQEALLLAEITALCPTFTP